MGAALGLVSHLNDNLSGVPHGALANIALTKNLEAFLAEQVRVGACTEASELVNAILRSVKEQQEKPFQATQELDRWLLEAANPVTPLTKADFSNISENSRRSRRASAP